MNASDEFHARLDDRQLLLQALAAFVFGLTGLLFALEPASFVLAYLLQLWVVMCVAGSLMFWSDEKRKAGNYGPVVSIVTSVIMFTILWAVAVALPLGMTWLEAVAPDQLSLWPILADAAPVLGLSLPFFVLMAWRLLRRYEREKAAGRTPDLKTSIWHRMICLYAFVLAGPFLYLFAHSSLAAVWPTLAESRRLSFAIVLSYACCEAYPYLAVWFERRDAARRRSTPPVDGIS